MGDVLRPVAHDSDFSESELPPLPGLVGAGAMMFLGIAMYKMLLSKRKRFPAYYLTPQQRGLLMKIIARGEEKRWDFSYDEDFMFKLLPAFKAIAMVKRAPGGMLPPFLLSATAIGLLLSRRVSNSAAGYTKALQDEEQNEEKCRSEELQKRVYEQAAGQRKAGITVLLVDDHAMVRQGLRTVMEAFPNIEIVGEASNGNEAVTLVERSRPAVVLMDINMPKLNGIEATARIKTEHPNVAIIGLSVNADSANQEAMKKAGATMLLPKEAVIDELYNAILSVSS
jgi:CheY-like chemotaxis protein